MLHDSDTSTAGLKLGYRFQNGVAEYARIQAFNSANGTPLAINPNGGNVGVGSTMVPSKLHVEGSVGVKVVLKTASYTAADETVILVDASGGVRTITLPQASTVAGRIYYVKKTDSSANAVIIQRSSSDLVDGLTSRSITTQYGCMQVVSAGGTAWQIIGQK